MDLKKYVEYRKAELTHEFEGLGEPGDISMGSTIARREHYRRAIEIVSELEHLVRWLDAGEPEWLPPLSEADRAAWRTVKAKGYDIPAEIEAQL